MRNKIVRELYLLPRWEQKAILWLSCLLLLTSAVRLAVGVIPPREPPGISEFMEEAQRMMDSLHTIKLQRIDLNRADSSALLPLPGIGPAFAARIVKYRELLGGYVSHDQLREVYGLPGETIRMLVERVFIDTLAIRKLNLDTVSFRQLLRHPYLGYEQVRTLIRYREVMGGIESIDELITNELIPDTTLVKLAPYLRFGPPPDRGDEK
ncbi:MAG: helix-hairpin-helix domain-containing protein [Bacteroidales bacterium]